MSSQPFTPAAPQAKREHFPLIDLRGALAAERPTIDFVLPGLVAGTVGALVAPGATGKSTLALQLCAGVALGAQPLGGLFPAVMPGRAVLVTAEDPRPILVNRLKDLANWLLSTTSVDTDELELLRAEDVLGRLQANLRVASSCGLASALMSRGQSQHSAVEELVQLAQGARLLVIDPLRRFHDGDENDSGAATVLVQVIESIAQRTGAAILLSHHTSKGATLGGAGSEQQAARGSSALTDGVRWQANLRVMSEQEAMSLRVPEERRRQYVRFDIPKANYASPFPGAWLRRGAGGMQTYCQFPGVDSTTKRATRGGRERARA